MNIPVIGRLIAVVVFATAMVSATAQAAPELRSNITVKGVDIFLGDIFLGVGDLASVRIASAPEPGERITMRVPSLQEFIKSHGLEWKPGIGVNQVAIRRAGKPISRREYLEVIRPALAEMGMRKPFQLELRSRGLALIVPVEGRYRVGIEALDFDQRTLRFDASLVVSGDGFADMRIEVTGLAHRIMQIPILTRTIDKGDIIKERDVGFIDMQAEDVRRDIATRADRLIGQQARRQLRPDGPVRLSDVREPILVEKGALVTMQVRSRSMVLTATGIALEDGALGDVVQIRNPKSRKVVQGVVAGRDQIRMITRSLAELAAN